MALQDSQSSLLSPLFLFSLKSYSGAFTFQDLILELCLLLIMHQVSITDQQGGPAPLYRTISVIPECRTHNNGLKLQ